LVAISAINCARLAAITGGGIVAANAVSYAATAALACNAVCSAWAAAAVIHAAYGAAAAAIAADDGPCQEPITPETTPPKDAAVEFNPVAKLSQAAAAASIGPAPGPAYIRAELISGGNSPKSITTPPCWDSM
jgi:hypothetical protein